MSWLSWDQVGLVALATLTLLMVLGYLLLLTWVCWSVAGTIYKTYQRVRDHW